MKIRPATPEDAPAIRGLLAENGMLVDGLSYDRFSPLAVVLEIDGEVRAYGQALIGAPVSFVTDVAVSPLHQRKGYGVRIIESLELLLREYGATAWMAATYVKDEGMAEMMERRGGRCLGTGRGWVTAL